MSNSGGGSGGLLIASSPSLSNVVSVNGEEDKKALLNSSHVQSKHHHHHKHSHHRHHHHHDDNHSHHHHSDDEEEDITDQTHQLINNNHTTTRTSDDTEQASPSSSIEVPILKLDDETLRKIYLSKSRPLWKEPDFVKLVIMITMVFLMFLGEIQVGIIAESLTLLADAFHMLSDGISLVVGAACIWLAKKSATNNMTYGFGRAETLGGLINAVFLVSVVLYVIMESIQRFFIPERIENPLLVLCVGGAGLLVNLIGLVMFCGHHPHPGHDHDHGHGHGHHHGHSHGSHDEHHSHDEEEHSHDHAHDHDHSHDHELHDVHASSSSPHQEKPKPSKQHHHRSENIFGVFLHILGDFLGSIAVMISAGLLMIFDKPDDQGNYTTKWVLYVDPILSLIMSCIILFTAVPLLKSTSRTLLQSVPANVKITDLKEKIMKIEGVISCHELHVWQFVGKKSIASVHVLTSQNSKGFMKIARQIQNIFHKHDIHSSTIQPEFTGNVISRENSNQEDLTQPCRLICNKSCYEQFCCAPDVKDLDVSNKV
ncbi:hypothetical protein C9374_009149 [Naegleria lovaniensis]|uniref:Cation efflux protein transmembrane domain-containing protein n=1 Tax=Naegleria lovaniensis TaxID=51637 RepID=A0AA88GK72_NAELO|nr:uncharacterized protein C9374_009149 [Naegleria lovaniensis]KAG2377633.1 hypothetical protein C9374_009149 [Naegleria lovaniensis]